MSKENVKYPHQEVIEYYELSLDGLGKATRETVEQLNSKISEMNNAEDGDELVEDMKETLAKSKLIAGVIIAENKKNDTEKEKAEVAKEVEESVKSVKEEIKAATAAAAAEEKAAQAKAAEEEEEEEEEDVPPPPARDEEKIQTIIDFFKEYKVATEDELAELGLKNFKGAKEIMLVPNKYMIVLNDDGDYVLKKNSGDGLGWILLGIGALIAGFFGYRAYKNK